MNKRLRLSTVAILLAVSGCHSITIPTPTGPATVRSFGQRTKITELRYGELYLKGYNNDQVSALMEAFEAGKSAAKLAAPVPIP